MSSISTPGSLDAWLIDEEEDDLDFTVTVEEKPEETHAEEPAKAAADNAEGDIELPLDVDLDLDEPAAPSPDPLQETAPGVSELASGLSELIELDTRVPRISDGSQVCKRCGEVIAAGHRFCGSCGTKYDSNYDSGYDFSSSRPSMVSATEGVPVKRGVERVSFVKQHVSSVQEHNACPFEVRHINDDGSEGEVIPIFEGENFIGRASSLQLGSDRYVSPHHIRLVCTGREMTLEDCNSLNGVFLKVTGASVEVSDGDIFRIGEELLCYFHGSSAQVLLSNQTSEKTELLGNEEAPGWGYLRVVMGAYAEGSVYRLSQPTVTIGRTHADILFPRDGFVSGSHATIRAGKGGAILTDLDSSNGTFVRIRGMIRITETIHVLIGNQLLRIARL